MKTQKIETIERIRDIRRRGKIPVKYGAVFMQTGADSYAWAGGTCTRAEAEEYIKTHEAIDGTSMVLMEFPGPW